jgi:hypothetical protein
METLDPLLRETLFILMTGRLFFKEFNMKNKWFSVLPVLAVVFLSFTLAVCGNKDDGDITGSPGDDPPPPGSIAITFSNLTASGSPTDKLTLTFNQAVTDLSEADISLTPGSTGATKGALTNTSGGVYELALNNVTTGGSVSVGVSKSGYSFTPPSRNVTVTVPYVPPVDFENYTVWFNTGFADSGAINPVKVSKEAGDKKISAPSTPTKDGFSFTGWYKTYGVDPATGLWKYESGDEWDFGSDAVSDNMTLYAGWTGGVKRIPVTWIWQNQPNILQGRLIQLEAGKTYRMGARYILSLGGWGPVYLIARYRTPNGGYITETPRVTLATTTSNKFFEVSEQDFTASYTGWYFIGISIYNAENDPPGGGSCLFHEVWLKERGGGDINLLANGDFILKEDNKALIYNSVANKGQDPLYEGPSPAPRSEWNSGKWNFNHDGDNNAQFPYLWSALIGSEALSFYTGGGTNSYSSLVFPKPAHP